MNASVGSPGPLKSPATGMPSPEGLRLILAGVMYLLAVCVLQIVVMILLHSPGAHPVPSGVMDIRDVVALFGWVGLMISGVSVIIVPNHLRVRIRPLGLPTAHLVLSNVGLVGFLATSILLPGGTWPGMFLVLVSSSFLAFGLGFVRTLLPFMGRPFRSATGAPTVSVPR